MLQEGAFNVSGCTFLVEAKAGKVRQSMPFRCQVGKLLVNLRP